MNLIKINNKVNIVSGYYHIKLPNKPKPTKFDEYYHFYGTPKLLEEMDGNVIELSPNSFCRVNYHISKHLYHKVYQMIKQITNNFSTNHNLVCFEEIQVPQEYYHNIKEMVYTLSTSL